MSALFKNLKKWEKNKEYSKLAIFVLVFLVILELTVFNYKFYANMDNQVYIPVPILNGNIHNYYDNEYELGDGDKSIEIKNINQHIKNLHFDTEIIGVKQAKEDKKITVVISATDAGNSTYFDLPERTIVYNNESSKYIPLNLNGDSYKLKITFKDCNNKNIVINRLAINDKVPFGFSAIRVLVLFIIIAVVYILKPKSGFYSYKFNIKSKKQSRLITIIAVLNVAVILALGFAHPNTTINTVSHQNQYNWLAEAMLDGHFYLNDEPSDTLKQLENPYDRRARDDAMARTGDKYKWDTAYYNGKYYVYFGIVPELLFFLPATAMGVMIINKAPVIIMTMLAVIFGYLLIREITRRWFKNVSYLVYVALSVLFVNSIGIYTAIRIPDLYMLPISHALAFSLMGVYCWIKSLKDENRDKVSILYLTLGSVCLALVAGCRPQICVVSFIALPLFWNTVFKDRELFSFKSIGRTVGFLLPYIVVAAFLMYYNYSRFGSPFDFGANYNLTVMDMVSEKFNIGKIPLAIYTYFLQPPNLMGTFPYIKNVAIDRTFMGNYVMEAEFGGMLPCNILLLSFLFVYKVRDSLKEKKLYIPMIMMIVFGLFIAIVDSNTGGLVFRYMNDFMWPIFIAMIIVVYALVEKYNDTPLSAIAYRCVAVGFVWSMFYNFIVLFNTNAASYKDNIPVLYYYVKHLIEFWS